MNRIRSDLCPNSQSRVYKYPCFNSSMSIKLQVESSFSLGYSLSCEFRSSRANSLIICRCVCVYFLSFFCNCNSTNVCIWRIKKGLEEQILKKHTQDYLLDLRYLLNLTLTPYSIKIQSNPAKKESKHFGGFNPP